MNQNIQSKTGRIFRESWLIFLGVISACFGLKSFLIPNHFIDGGVTGISLLVGALTNWKVPYLILIFNIPFVILGYKQMGKIFALKTCLAIVLLSLFLVIIPFPSITREKVLVAFFGGFFLGGGIGLVMRGACVIDGTEVLALYLSKKSVFSVGNIILGLNIIIFAFAAIFLNIDIALYAILTYLSASNTVDFVVNGLDQYIGVTIISEKNQEIKAYIINEMKRGVTVYKGEGGYGDKKDRNILYTVVTILEMSKLNNEIRQIDPNAFVVQQQISGLKGGVVKRNVLH